MRNFTPPTRVIPLLLLFGLWLAGAAPIRSQTVASTLENSPFLPHSTQTESRPLKQVLKEIEGKFKVYFIYNAQTVAGKTTTLRDVDAGNLENLLHQLLAPASLRYKRVKSDTYAILEIPLQEPAKGATGPAGSGSGLPDGDGGTGRRGPSSPEGFAEPPAELTVRGRVKTEAGEPLPGVTVLLRGTTTGTATNGNGEYSLTVPDGGGVLVFSFIGYLSQEVPIGGRSEINVTLAADVQQLNEVVVTSFGIRQEKKSLSYAVQDVKGQEIVASQQPNLVNGLQGKISGLQVTSSGGAPGASASLVIRGGTSLDGNNEPLFVVDGIPVDNSTLAEPAGGSGQLARTVSNSNRGIDLNPADIESVTVLKGPAAAALYGLRAAAGAVVITTKRGAAGQGRITYSNSFEWNQVNKLPALQSAYKMGNGGQATASRLSWGPAFAPGERVYNNLDDFFGTGTLFNHNLSFSGGSDRATVYASLSRTDQKGNVPNTSFDRTSLRLNADVTLLKNLKAGLTANYINSGGRKPLQGPGVLNGTGGYLISMLYWPRSDDMAHYLNPDGTRRRLVENINEDIDNPYWSVRKNPVTDEVNRFIGTAQLSYDPAKWASITYRLGTDFYQQDYQSLRSPGTSLRANENGGLFTYDLFNQITTSTLLATFRHTAGPVGASLLLGHNAEFARSDYLSVFATDFLNPDFVSINNTGRENQTNTQQLTRRRLVGGFGELQLNYKQSIFLTVTGRNDWSSTLPRQNRSFFYPSVGGSVVFTQLLGLESKVLSFGKVRASWARVGKDAPPHKLETGLQTNAGVGGGFIYGFFANNTALRPEFTTSVEGGVDLRFLGGRLGVDATVYQIDSRDQIVQPRVSQGTGFIFKLVNGGAIRNKGVELTLTAAPVRKSHFSWDLSLNWSRNVGRVTDLPVGTSVFRQSDAIAVFNLAEGASYLNGDFYAIRGSRWETAPDGQLLISASGYPIVNKAQQVDLGVSRQPDWIAGLTNTLTYRSLALSFLIDVRQGGAVFNGTDYELVLSGLSPRTLDRGTSRVFAGVVQNADGSYSPNTQEVVLDQNYYRTIYAEHAPNFVEDGSWYRLRYLSLTWSLPRAWLGKTPLSNASFNVTGKNLLLITPYSGMDPEVSSGGAGVRGTGTVGIDYAGVPATRGISVGLNITL